MTNKVVLSLRERLLCSRSEPTTLNCHWSLPAELRQLLNTNPSKNWLAFALIAGGLTIWAGLFALGAYLEWGADRPRHDYRKPLIIMATMASFLAVWGMALWLRARRGR